MIIGKKIILRRVEKEDLERIAEWRNTPEINKYFFNLFPICKSNQERWFEQLINSSDRILFIIEDKKNKKPIGTAGLQNIDFKNQNAEYGNILIGELEYRGKGYAVDATTTLLKFSFEEMNLERIYIYVLEFNSRSIKPSEKIGFHKEGILRRAFFTQGKFVDIILMAILRKEFQEARFTEK